MNELKILSYSPSFPEKFESIKNEILRVIGHEVDISHIGSTAIPGMSGKGVIDVLVGARNWREGNEIASQLEAYGFFPGEAIRGRIFLSLRKGMKDTHIHIVRKGTKQYGDLLNFRDYLRTHFGERKKYLRLKKKLYQLQDKEKYSELKSRYVKSILQRMKN